MKRTGRVVTMALIDRQTLIDSFCSQCTVDKPETCSTIRYGDKWCNEVYTILNAPTVDAVPVVRCKDCNEYQDNFHWCKLHDVEMQPLDFCSYGERKDAAD